MTSPARTFHLGDLITVATGRLVAQTGIDAVYDVCDYVTGEAHMTHQLPRASREITPWLVEQHPWLADITVPGWVCDKKTVDYWLAERAAEHGEQHQIKPLPFGAYVGRDPIAEIREMAPQAQILAVEVDGSPS